MISAIRNELDHGAELGDALFLSTRKMLYGIENHLSCLCVLSCRYDRRVIFEA